MTQPLEKSIEPEDFYSPLHKRIYKAMITLFERGDRIDPILIGEELKKDGSLDSVGGIASITNLTHGLPMGFKDLYDYIKVVKEKSITRQFIKICYEAVSEALAEETPIFEIINNFQEKVFALRGQEGKKGFVNAGTEVRPLLERVKANADRARDGGGVLDGPTTGYRDLNQKTSGMPPGALIIVAARPSMGKTSLAIDKVLNATTEDPEAVFIIFSLESTKQEIIFRLITQLAKVDSSRFKECLLTPDEWGRVAFASSEIEKRKIFIDDTPGLSVLDMQARAMQLQIEQGRLDGVEVDHMGLIKGSGRKERRLELGEISKALKATAKLLNVPVILLCQLGRGPEARTPPKPMMSDLRESGEIEEDADIIELIYRPAYYPKQRTNDNHKEAEIIVAKNRNGPTGTVYLTFLEYCTHFENRSLD